MYRPEKIKGRQAELGWTNAVLADRAGVHEDTVSNIRNGKSVSTDTLDKVIKALGMTPVEAVTEPKPQPEPVNA